MPKVSVPRPAPAVTRQHQAGKPPPSWITRVVRYFVGTIRSRHQTVPPPARELSTPQVVKPPAPPPPRPSPTRDRPRPLRKIAIINQKGGVGKTTTAVNLAGAFAEQGYRTLLLDCDAQGDLSTVFLPGHGELPHSIADVFAGTPVPTRELIHTLAFENLFLIPADRRLNQFDKTYGYEADPKAMALADALAEVEREFDMILFDCAPRAHLSSFAALVAATDVLVPVQPSQFAVASILTLHDEIQSVRVSRNPQLSIRGYFLSMLRPRSPTQQTCRKALIQALGESLVLKTAIPEMATFDTAINLGKPVTLHAPRSRAAAIVRAFATELLSVPSLSHA